MTLVIERPRRRYRRQTDAPTQLVHPLERAWSLLRHNSAADPLAALHDLSWLLLLRLLDDGDSASAGLTQPHRWRDWARQERSSGALLGFINDDLIPHLTRSAQRSHTNQSRLISAALKGVTRLRVTTDAGLRELLEAIDAVMLPQAASGNQIAAQVYDRLLARLDIQRGISGLHVTPAALGQAMAQALDPCADETIYDPACGVGDLLVQAVEAIQAASHGNLAARQVDMLTAGSYYGCEPDSARVAIALVRLLLRGIARPQLCCGDALCGDTTPDQLDMSAPHHVDLVLANPPFSGRATLPQETRGGTRTAPTPLVFLQHAIASLRPGGRCGIILPEGMLCRTDELALIQTRQQLIESCDLWCVVSLPIGAFPSAEVKTNILFFTAGASTSRTWYYDLSGLKIGKRHPLRPEHFVEFLALLPTRATSVHSWMVERQTIAHQQYRLHAVNPHTAEDNDLRTPEELLALIDAQGREFEAAMARLRSL